MSLRKQELDSAPSIVELLYSAKKLLNLQSRVENRQLRKENFNIQNGSIRKRPENKVLDLLSPLSIDDLKTSPPNSQKVGTSSKNTFKYDANNASQRSFKGGKSQILETTPNSMNDSPPEGNKRQYEGSSGENMFMNGDESSWPSGRSSAQIKKEPSTTLSTVQISSDNSKNGPTNGGFWKSTAKKSTALEKSKLTSSLAEPKNEGPLFTTSTSNTSNNAAKTDGKTIECFNCHTLKTPLWRKDPEGNTLCNACGLFLKLHGTMRPLSLKTDVIKKRNSRRSSNTQGKYGSLSRHNSTQDLTSANRHSSKALNSIPIQPNTNGAFSHSSSASSSVNNGLLSTSGGISNGNTPRYKNVLILPKPQSATNISIPNTPQSTSGSYNMKSIPIPNSTFKGADCQHSPSSPLTTSGSNSNSHTNLAKSYKRKKSDFGEYVPTATDSLSRRVPSQVSLSQNNKRNSVTKPSSFQSSSLTKRPSMTSVTLPQRKLSLIGTAAKIDSSENQLTFSNINFLNKKSLADPYNTYFDTTNSNNSPIKQNDFLGTPGSIASHSSFSSNNLNPYPNAYNVSSDNNNLSLTTPTDNFESAPSSSLPMGDHDHHHHHDHDHHHIHNQDNDNDHFFNSINNDNYGFASLGDKVSAFDIPTPQKSTLTDGLDNIHPQLDMAQMIPNIHNSSIPTSRTELKDLDWLKFDI